MLLSPPGLPTHAALCLVDTESRWCVDDGGGTFTIRGTTYNTAKLIEKFPALGSKCLCVGASWQPPGLRETLHPHWNGQAQSGDSTHAGVGKGKHAQIVGITGYARNTLDFARQ